MNRNLILLLATVSLVILLGLFYKYTNTRKEVPFVTTNLKSLSREWKKIEVKIGDKNYDIFVTENDTDKKNGLAIFDDIKENEGMLFEFEQEDYHTFWMRGMKFDIDIIFLDGEKKVIQIFENVQKDSYKSEEDYKLYTSKLKSKYVIEIKSGEVKKNNLKIGDVIKL